jgi:protein TonB
MKAVNKLVVLLIVGVWSVVAAFAAPNEDAYLESCRKDPGVPVPIAVTSPLVGPEYAGTTVQLEFTVDAQGKTAAFSIKSAPDEVLAKAVVEAVKRWRFQPAESNGVPVATKVLLPVKVVDPLLESGHGFFQ